ncbi:hypothetical protein HZA96_06310 [Candidatus Woesearchaeota archaeon]|nr:hypothetical protein [Candidatus Woesearchaeota archaeon]
MYEVRKALGVYSSDDLIKDYIVPTTRERSFDPRNYYDKGDNKCEKNGQPDFLRKSGWVRK